MTIDEAIEVLEAMRERRERKELGGAADALGLGIQALKSIKLQREDIRFGCPVFLEGETK